ncbi:RNA polymerase subunit sigma-24, partial [bacterium]|nr:RNA polymerase subunit sigma-24 [bacterium]
LKKLPEIQSEVIVLRFIEGLSSKEVGKILKKSDGAIRIIQYRALKKLKEILKEDFKFLNYQ